MKKESGFTLVEMMLAIGIGMVILLAVWLKFAKFKEENEILLQSEAVQTLFVQGNSIYSDSIEFSNDVTGSATPISLPKMVATTSLNLPDPIINGMISGGGFTNIWGGDWLVYPESSDGGATQDIMVVEVSAVPQSACRMLLVQLAPQMYDTNVNNQLVPLAADVNADGDNSFVWRNSLSMESAFAVCNQRNRNTMKFRQLKELDLTSLRRIQPNPTSLTNEENGTIPANSRYRYNYLSQYNRVQSAMQSREDAQALLGP